MLKLSENLKIILKERNLSVTTLAKLAGVPKTNLQGWVRDNAQPNLIQLEKVAQYLGLTIEQLAFGKKQKSVVEDIFETFELHNGLYEISIKKVKKRS